MLTITLPPPEQENPEHCSGKLIQAGALHEGFVTQQADWCRGACLGDVGLAARGVVGGVFLVHNLGVGVDHLLHHLGQLQHGELCGVANVEGPRVRPIHHAHHACRAQVTHDILTASPH